MAIITLFEIIDLIIMALALGFIFKGIYRDPYDNYDPLKQKPKFSMSNEFRDAMYVAAPAVILHELGHKFFALALGGSATFHASYFWLLLGVVLSLMNFGLIFFVPGYVSISGISNPLHGALIAFAGPLMNLILFGAAYFALKYMTSKKMNKSKKYVRYFDILIVSKKINGFLFVFNMIPLWFFDGSKVLNGLLLYFGI